MDNHAILINNLTKIYPPNHKALDDLDLSVNNSEVMALLGPNGAGKTTTIRVLSTLSGFDSGKVIVAGLDVDIAPDKVRQTIGVVAQQTGIDYFLTGRENMRLQGHLYHMKKNDVDDRIRELAEYFDLSAQLDNVVSTYSGGIRRKLDIATALIHRPKVLFLDEPTLGLDIRSRKTLWKHIEELNTNFGLTILLTTHYLEEADSLSDRVAIINSGKIRIIGTPDELKNSIKGDSVVITFEKIADSEQSFAYLAKQQDYVEDTVWEGNNLHLYVGNGAECVPKLMVLASQNNVEVKSLALSRPSLDDVFLKYTGSSMQGPPQETTDEWWKQWAGKGGGKWQGKWESDAAQDENEEKKSEESWQDKQWPSGSDERNKSDQSTTGAWQDDQQTGSWPGKDQWGKNHDR
jgi:ABC-2 type transport system ATP-binding protein